MPVYLHDVRLQIDIPEGWQEQLLEHALWSFVAEERYSYRSNITLSSHYSQTEDPEILGAEELSQSLLRRHPDCQILAADTVQEEDVSLCCVRYRWQPEGREHAFEQMTLLMIHAFLPKQLIQIDFTTIAPLLADHGPLFQSVLQSLTPCVAADLYEAPDLRHFSDREMGLSLLFPLSFFEEDACAGEHLLLREDLDESDEEGQAAVLSLHWKRQDVPLPDAAQRLIASSLAIERPAQELLQREELDQPTGSVAYAIYAFDDPARRQRLLTYQYASGYPRGLAVITAMVHENRWPSIESQIRTVAESLRHFSSNDLPSQAVLLLDHQDKQWHVIPSADDPSEQRELSLCVDKSLGSLPTRACLLPLPGYSIDDFEEFLLSRHREQKCSGQCHQLIEEARWHSVDFHPLYLAAYRLSEEDSLTLEVYIGMGTQALMLRSVIPDLPLSLSDLGRGYAGLRIVCQDGPCS